MNTKKEIIETLKKFEQRDYKNGGVSVAPEMYDTIAEHISKSLTIFNIMPCFHFKRFHEGTEHNGWEITIFGFCFKWMKFPNFKKYTYWRGKNFGKIAIWNRSIEFTLPCLKNDDLLLQKKQ